MSGDEGDVSFAGSPSTKRASPGEEDRSSERPRDAGASGPDCKVDLDSGSENRAFGLKGTQDAYFQSPSLLAKTMLLVVFVLFRFTVYFIDWRLQVPRCPPLPVRFERFVEWQLVDTATILVIGIPFMCFLWNYMLSPLFGARRIRYWHGLALLFAFSVAFIFCGF